MKFAWLLFLFPITAIFPHKIGIVYKEPYKYSNCIPCADRVITAVNQTQHSAVFANISDASTLNECDFLITIIPYKELFPYHKKTIIYMLEPPVTVPLFAHKSFLNMHHKIFSFDHARATAHGKYRKSFFPCFKGLTKEWIPFSERKLSCLINSYLRLKHPKELYSQRRKIASFYKNHHVEDLSLYGSRGWSKNIYTNHLGNCPDKFKVLREHKFSYVYENWDNDQHYISEKIFDCMASKCVPIYLGSSKVSDYIPKECYVDARAFASINDIHEFISAMDEETWLSYIRAIEAFAASESAKYFTEEFFIEQILDLVSDL